MTLEEPCECCGEPGQDIVLWKQRLVFRFCSPLCRTWFAILVLHEVPLVDLTTVRD